MDGTMSEIRLFAGNFAPKGWNLCDGSLLSVNVNQALFALLGTTYGGNGLATFALPDLRGRTAVGTGNGLNLSNYVLGQMSGVSMVTLLSSQIPTHTHVATASGTASPGGGSATLMGVNAGGSSSPGGNYLGADDSGMGGVATYAAAGTGTLVAMESGSLVTNSTTLSPPTVAIGVSGASQPHDNSMPSLALNYIICVMGIFPSRD